MAGRLILNTKYRWLYCNMIMKPFQLSTRFFARLNEARLHAELIITPFNMD